MYYKFIRILQIPLSNNEKGVYSISWNSNFHVMKIAIFIVDARAAWDMAWEKTENTFILFFHHNKAMP